jgi:hypothetical protein
VTKDLQRHHHINVLRAPGSARQAVPASVPQAAALVAPVAHARGVRFNAVKYADFALRKI